MVLLSWFSRAMIFRRAQEENFQSLPDDLVINILSRLPAETILRCRRVCKTWRNLTSTSSFTESLFKAVKPSVLIPFKLPSSLKFCLFKRETERQQICLVTDEAIGPGELTVTPISRSTSVSTFRYFICNPITHENITLPCPEKRAMRPCGFFFHPLTQEHRVLYVYDEGHHYVYKIFSLETNSWRNLSGTSYNEPTYCRSPTVVNGNLHWMLRETRQVSDVCANIILRFDLNTEILDTVPHPEYENCSTRNHPMYLSEVEGELCLLHLLRMQSYMRINSWILVDITNKHWGKSSRFGFNCRTLNEAKATTFENSSDQSGSLYSQQDYQIGAIFSTIGALLPEELTRG